STPVLYNDPGLIGRVQTTLQSLLGKDKVVDIPRHMSAKTSASLAANPARAAFPSRTSIWVPWIPQNWPRPRPKAPFLPACTHPSLNPCPNPRLPLASTE